MISTLHTVATTMYITGLIVGVGLTSGVLKKNGSIGDRVGPKWLSVLMVALLILGFIGCIICKSIEMS